MSFNSCHTEHKLIGGMFTTVVVITVEMLKKTWWDHLAGWFIHMTGQTKFQEFSIVAFFLKHKLDPGPAAAAVGYSQHLTPWDIKAGNKHPGRSISNVSKRILRNCTASYLEAYEMLVEAKLLEKGFIREILTEPLFRPKMGVATKHVGKCLCTEAVRRYGSVEEAARILKVETHIIQFWLNYVEL